MSQQHALAEDSDTASAASERSARIRELNEATRRRPFEARIFVARRLTDLGGSIVPELVGMAMEYSDFDPETDPTGEHQSGTFDVRGLRVLWQIHYLDAKAEGLSPDPADPKVTSRMIAFKLADV